MPTAIEVGQVEKEYLLHPWIAQKNYSPLTITRGKGSYFWDNQGNKYLDFASQLVNLNAGHQHPKILQAIKDQVDKLCYVVPSAANEQRALLGKMLAEIAPGDLCRSFLVTGGGVANENALKIARAFTGRQKIIARHRSFHGATYGASSVMGDPRHIIAEPGVPGTVRVWDPFCYRCFFKMSYPECGIYCADAIREVIEVEGPKTIAAMIVEPITGSNCRIIPPAGYMKKIRKICDEYEILLICDEVMTGFGRTGKWFASSHWDVVPDIMTLSKGINSGYLPLGAVMTNSKIAGFFDDNILYGGLTQFGNPVSCAAAVAAIQVYEEEGMVENSYRLGEFLLQSLKEIKDEHPCVGDVRGKGLFAAIELVKNRETKEPLIPWTANNYENKPRIMKKLLGKLKEEGVYTYARWDMLMICPPLCISKEELSWGLNKISKALDLVDDYLLQG